MSARNTPQLEIVAVDVTAVAKGYRVSALLGSDVINDEDKKIGTLDDLVVADDDRVLFVVIQVGGHLVAIPYQSLVLDDTDDGLRIILPGATRDALGKLPEFDYDSL